MILTVFFIPFGVPMLGYAWVRIRWANRCLRRRGMEKRDFRLNVAAGTIALGVYALLAIALWPGQPVGYLVGGVFAAIELALVVVASRAAAAKHSHA
jgi:hypothetical protein